MKQKVTIEIISFLLILLFVYAVSSKLFDYNTFKIQLSNSPFLKPFADNDCLVYSSNGIDSCGFTNG